MFEKYYALATGEKGETTLGLNYDCYKIVVYTDETSAKEKLEELCLENKLEGKVINLTPFVQMGVISKKHLRIRD
jgi:hypothetical protein